MVGGKGGTRSTLTLENVKLLPQEFGIVAR